MEKEWEAAAAIGKAYDKTVEKSWAKAGGELPYGLGCVIHREHFGELGNEVEAILATYRQQVLDDAAERVQAELNKAFPVCDCQPTDDRDGRDWCIGCELKGKMEIILTEKPPASK